MFKTVVVGLDGRSGGQDALALARALASADTRIVAVHAYPYEIHPTRGSVGGFANAMEEEAEKSLAAWVGDSGVERRVIADVSPARALHFVADDLAADLIVVCACHRTTAGRIFLGDVARTTLDAAHCMTAVAPAGYRDGAGRIERIGLGFNETPEAEAALLVAERLAAQLGAGLQLCMAVPTATPFVPANAYAIDWPGLLEADLTAARSAIDGRAASLSVPATTTVVNDSAGTALVELSEGVDLTVVGSRGWGAAKSVVLGSTSHRLAHEAHSPLLVVPAPAREASEPQHSESAAVA
ncbi:MAG: universal stress protein [Solirubrobacteraceae bacterium]